MNVMVCKKQKSEKDKTGHKQDFYPTPTSLVKELLKTGVLDKSKVILDPACGQHAIDDTLRDTGLFRKVIGTDIIYGDDFLIKKYKPNYCDTIVMNPPFELFDEFVAKAKDVAPLVVSICKTDLFSAYKRYYNGLWKNLKEVYIFDGAEPLLLTSLDLRPISFRLLSDVFCVPLHNIHRNRLRILH